MIKTDINHRHLSPETPSQGIIAQTPQFVNNMFSALEPLTNSENNILRPNFEKKILSHFNLALYFPWRVDKTQ